MAKMQIKLSRFGNHRKTVTNVHAKFEFTLQHKHSDSTHFQRVGITHHEQLPISGSRARAGDAHGDRLLDLQKYCHFRRVKTPGSEPPCRTPCVPGARPWTPT